MSTQRELLKQSLVALKDSSELVSEWGTYADDYSKNKYGLSDDIDKYNRLIEEIEAELAKPEQEPVGQLGGCGAVNWFNNPPKRGTYLYTSPPQYNPLSDDEINNIWDGTCCDSIEIAWKWQKEDLLEFVRAIEKRIIEGKT